MIASAIGFAALFWSGVVAVYAVTDFNINDEKSYWRCMATMTHAILFLLIAVIGLK